MSLSARQLRYLVETGRLGSIHAAARALAISQSSILAALDKAEAGLGARIFERWPARGVKATPAGERFLIAARSMLAAQDAFDRQVNALAAVAPKVVRIACFEPFGALFMTEVLRRYIAAIGPTEILLLEGDQTQLAGWLESGAADIVVAYAIGPAFAEATPICHAPIHALLHRDDPLAQAPAVSLADLATRPIVLLDLPHTATFLMTVFGMFASAPRVSLRTRSYETVRSAVASGFGAALLNLRPMSPAAQDGDLVTRRPILDDVPDATLVVADSYQGMRPAFVSAFIEEMRRYFREVGPERFAVCAPERRAKLIAS